MPTVPSFVTYYVKCDVHASFTDPCFVLFLFLIHEYLLLASHAHQRVEPPNCRIFTVIPDCLQVISCMSNRFSSNIRLCKYMAGSHIPVVCVCESNEQAEALYAAGAYSSTHTHSF